MERGNMTEPCDDCGHQFEPNELQPVTEASSMFVCADCAEAIHYSNELNKTLDDLRSRPL